MLSYLVALSSAITVSTFGGHYYSSTDNKLLIEFRLSPHPDYESFLLITNLFDDLFLNGKKVTSQVYRCTSDKFLFEYTQSFTLHFNVVPMPTSCDTLEFLFNPQNNQEYKYEPPLDRLKTYCLVASNKDTFDFEIRVTSGTLKYSSTDLYDGTTLNSGGYVKTQNDLLLIQFNPTSDDSSNANIKINLLSTSIATTTILYAKDKENYFSNTAVDTTAPKYSFMDYGTYSPTFQSSYISYNITSGTYVVFSMWEEVSALAMVESTQLDLLGNTNNVAVFFNQSGTLQIKSNSTSSGSATFTAFNMPSNCHYLITLSGDKSYKFNTDGSYVKCMVSAFKDGQVKVTQSFFGNLKTYDAKGSEISSSKEAEFYNPIYSVFTNDFTSSNEYFKHDISPYSSDKSIGYVIQGKSPTYNSLWIGQYAYDNLNSGEWSSKSGLAGWAIALIVFFVLIAIGVILLVILICCCHCCNCFVTHNSSSSSSSSSSSKKKHNTTATSTVYIQQEPTYPAAQPYPPPGYPPPQGYPPQGYPPQGYPPQQGQPYYPPPANGAPQYQYQPNGQMPPPPPDQPNPYT